MGTTEYYNKQVKDVVSGKSYDVEIGTSTFAGEGPQMYVNIDGASVLLSHEEATAFCQAVAKVSNYFGYEPADLDGQWVLRRD